MQGGILGVHAIWDGLCGRREKKRRIKNQEEAKRIEAGNRHITICPTASGDLLCGSGTSSRRSGTPRGWGGVGGGREGTHAHLRLIHVDAETNIIW